MLKFAITREDPSPELALIKKNQAKKALLVASGGCSLFKIKQAFPTIDITAFDFNPLQIQHCQNKIKAIQEKDRIALNIGHKNDLALNQLGEFEKLFQAFRELFFRFVADENEMVTFFQTKDFNTRLAVVKTWKANPYYRAIFQSIFNDELLTAMFTEKAIQNAEPNSYPAYFYQRITLALEQYNVPNNEWLHQFFLGYYLPQASPDYLAAQDLNQIQFVEGDLLAVKDIESYQMVSLSNIFDWSDDALVEAWAQQLRNLQNGAYVLIRQLNNERLIEEFFYPFFDKEAALMNTFLTADKSIFYNRFLVLRKNEQH